MKIRRATPADIPAIQQMAEVAFRSTYADILSADQLDYMMDWMYSAPSLLDQISGAGKDFFIACDERGAPLGYVSIEEEGLTPQGLPLVHLQKIYVLPDSHGEGIGRGLFTFVTDLLRERHPGGLRLELNVNRENVAVQFYEKMGMRRDRQGDFPIGHGYYMNDYIYALDIPETQPIQGSCERVKKCFANGHEPDGAGPKGLDTNR